MFKSVFTKYITAFMLITVISFAMLISIIVSVVNNYSESAKESLVERASHAVVEYFEQDLEQTGAVMNFKDYIESKQDNFQSMLDAFSEYAEYMVLLVTDNNGKILIASGENSFRYIKESISKSMMDEINNGDDVARTSDLDAILDGSHLISAAPIMQPGDSVVGTVFACASSVSLSSLLEVMIKTIVMASLWVILAALIAVYFISENIIGPLKAMSYAAKSFAAGKFDARVPVKGRDEIAELATAFNNMATDLENFENMRRGFLANVSHDLRTPMTTISGFIDGIIDGAIPPDKHAYYLNIIATEVRRLSRLVGTLLDISRLQSGDRELKKSAFDICEMARQIVISFEQKIDKKKLDVTFDLDSDNMLAFADRDAIYQIMYNLCDNAVKFSREGGKNIVAIHERDKKLLISVYNEGEGIAQEDLPFVFDRFYKSDKSRGLDKSGVGLGLYIAKTVIDAHDEKIWVESVQGKFCKFTFTLQATHNVAAVDSTHRGEEI